MSKHQVLAGMNDRVGGLHMLGLT